MTNQYPIYPYRQNNSIIKAFFAKPLTLFIAIGYALSAVYNFVTRLHIAPGSFYVNFDFVSIMMSIAFFMFYFSSKSSNPNTNYRAPVNLLKIVAIIYIVVVGLLILFFIIFFAAVAILAEKLRQPYMSLLLILTAFITPVIVVGLIYGISLLLFAGSVKKSVSTVFMYNKGAAALGVTSILLAVTSIATFVINTVYLPTIISDFVLYVENLLNSYGRTINYEQLINSLNNTNIVPNILSIIESSIVIILNILVGIFALSYRNYINKYIKSINDGSAPQQPQAEFSAPFTGAQSNPDNGFEQNGNPYVQNQPFNATAYQQTVSCPNCGCQCNSNTVFCSKCGAKLR